MIVSGTQFHVYLPRGQRLFSTSRSFKPGEGPSRGLLRDCENRLRNRWIVLQHYLGVDQLAALVAGEQVIQQHRGPAPVLAQPDLVGALPAVLLRARIIGSGMR